MILVQLLVEYIHHSNKRRFRNTALIRGRHLFQCRYPKVRRLLDGGTRLRPGAY